MNLAVRPLAMLALVLAMPAAVLASPALRGTMHAWRTQARVTQAILNGRAPFDATAIRAALQTYAADAARIGAQLSGTSADARDFKRRFAAFAADAQTALGDVAERPALRADMSRLTADCRSCHDAYN